MCDVITGDYIIRGIMHMCRGLWIMGLITSHLVHINIHHIVRFTVLMAASMKMAVF
jgi:hypothetical protein